MSPSDYRNLTFEGVQARIHGYRADVLAALRAHGPATTRELASFMRWDILRVRPRVTELYQLGFVVETTADETPTREGTYVALSDEEAMQRFRRQKFQSTNPQLQLL